MPYPGDRLAGSGKVIDVDLKLNDFRRKFALWDTPLSSDVCTEVLTGRSYPLLPVCGTVRTIVDVGAHVGAAAVYFALHYPQARVFAF